MNYKNLKKEELPKEFKARIERFNQLFSKATGHSFEEEEDLYQYEMGCIAQALSFSEYFKDKSLKEINETIKDKYNNNIWNFIDDIESKVPFFDETHSGNSLAMSWELFECYKIHPDMIPYMHGCLAPLVGDERYCDDRSDIPKWKSKSK
nr:MAG TPA: hypothetical protein [Bacteriophage sp.]